MRRTLFLFRNLQKDAKRKQGNGKVEHALDAWVNPISVFSVYDISVYDSKYDISEPKTSIPSFRKFPVSLSKLPPKTSHFSLAFDVPSEIPFPIQPYISN